MPISEAYRRGYRRAIQDAAEFAFQRKIVCEEAADKYSKEHPTDRYWSASERCAAREAGFIWEEVGKFKPRADRADQSSPRSVQEKP